MGSKLQKRCKQIALICAALLVAGGGLALLVWHFGNPALLDFKPDGWPLPYQSCWSILLAGVGIFLYFHKGRISWFRPIGFLIFSGAFLRLIEEMSGQHLGFTPILHSISGIATENFPPMVLLGVIGFSLIGLVFLFFPIQTRTSFKSALFHFISACVFIIGIFGVLAYVLPITVYFGNESRVPIHFYATLAMIVTGIALIACNIYEDSRQSIQIIKSLPILVSSTLIAFGFLLTVGLAFERSFSLLQIIQVKGNALDYALESDFDSQINTIKRMTKRLEARKELPGIYWEEDARSILEDMKDFVAIVWVNPQLAIEKQVFKTNRISSFDLSTIDKPSLASAANQKTPYVAVDKQNKWTELFFGVNWDGELKGYLVFIIDIQKEVELHLKAQVGNDYLFTIFYEDTVLASLNSDFEGVSRWQVKGRLSYENLYFTYLLSPRVGVLESEFKFSLIYFIFFSGIALSVASGLVIHLWIRARERIVALNKAENNLQAANDRILFTLTVAEIGTWSWNPETGEIEWDTVTCKLFAVDPKEHYRYEIFESRLHPDDRIRISKALELAMRTKTQFSSQYRVIHPDGSVLYILSKGRPHYDQNDRCYLMTGVCWDITNNQIFQLLIQSSEGFANIFADAKNISEAASKVIELLNLNFGWELIAVWIWDANKETLQCAKVAKTHAINIPAFEWGSQHLMESQGDLIPLKVWASSQPVWTNDFGSTSLIRAKAARESGIKGAVAFPILEGTKIVGVVELFRRTRVENPEKEPTARLLQTLGIDFGEFLRRKKSEGQLMELASIVTFSADGISSCDSQGRLRSWNRGAAAIFGYGPDEVIGNEINMLIPENERTQLNELLSRVIQTHSIERFEIQGKKKSGQPIWVNSTFSPLLDLEGNLVGISIVFRDVTAQLEISTALKRSEKRFRSVVEATGEWIWQTDAHQQVIYSSPAVEKTLGYTHQEIIGRDILDFLQAEDRKKKLSEIDEHIKKKITWTEDVVRWVTKNGSIRWLESTVEPIMDEEGAFLGFLGATRDVTERVEIEKTRKEFISVVNHELRTPLTSIHGALALLRKEGGLSEKGTELVAVAYRNSDRLAQIINDILDIEKMAARKLDMQKKPIVVHELVQDALRSVKPMADKFQIQLIEEPIAEDLFFEGDYDRLFQVMLNLISNAIKFSRPQGRVWVSAEKRDNFIRISVKDEGIGISEEFRPKIFQPFFQVDQSDTREKGGTGLGLTICKEIIEQHEGRIDFVSELGKGSTFFFEIPSSLKKPS